MSRAPRWRVSWAYLAFGSLSLLLLLFNLHNFRCLSAVETRHQAPVSSLSAGSQQRTYVVYGRDVDSGYLQHVFDMLHLYGYKRVPLAESTTWDLMWAHDYPFKNMTYLKNLLPYQKVNHFPGSGFITNKMDLSTSDFPFTPKAFKLPMQKEQFLKYVSDHPKKKYVVKSNDHRGIKIKEMTEINFNEKGIFIQEYVDDPFLVDGYKFDIGVYTTITSIDPLRVYVYEGDVLFRYCTEKYYPFDPSNTEKYVIGDDYLPTWEVPSLKKYYLEQGYSMKAAFNAYLIDKGLDHKKVWQNIEEAIRVVCAGKEPHIANLLKQYKSKNNFFEMMRFDFVIDSKLNVFLMEVNMSPNLSSLHFKPNRLLYEQVIFNLLSLVGLGIFHRNQDRGVIVSDKNVVINIPECKTCTDCNDDACQLCLPCMTRETKQMIKSSYIENMNRKHCKRVFPCDWEKNATSYGIKLSKKNKLLMKWYHEKCKEESNWCCMT